jgi:hypothetical protein
MGKTCKDNIIMDLKEIECENVDWMYLFQDRVQWLGLVNMAMNLRFHKRWEIS